MIADRQMVFEQEQRKFLNMKKFYDEYVKKLPTYQVGDWVLLREPKVGKFRPHWKGPYQIGILHDNNTVTLKNMKGELLAKDVNCN